VVEFCQAHGIAITAYMPLAYGKVLTEPLLMEIGKRHGVSAAQVSLAWLLAQGMTVIPSSTKRENLAANLAALKVRLSATRWPPSPPWIGVSAAPTRTLRRIGIDPPHPQPFSRQGRREQIRLNDILQHQREAQCLPLFLSPIPRVTASRFPVSHLPSFPAPALPLSSVPARLVRLASTLASAFTSRATAVAAASPTPTPFTAPLLLIWQK
jgi:hypothetical protein